MDNIKNFSRMHFKKNTRHTKVHCDNKARSDVYNYDRFMVYATLKRMRALLITHAHPIYIPTRGSHACLQNLM